MNSQIWSAPILFAHVDGGPGTGADRAAADFDCRCGHPCVQDRRRVRNCGMFSPADHRASSTRPAIVFFFGGGWISGTVEQFVPQSKHLAERGMIAIVADYRVRSRHNTTPFEAMADARSAMRWVRSHAKELGIDPGRLAAAGGSSGGHIAVSTAVFDRFDDPGEDKRISAKPDALVLFNPVVDTGASAPSVMNERFGGRGPEASPLAHLSRGLPPTLIVHGKADATVPYLSVERFCAEATRLGSRCELVGYEGAGHGFFNPARRRRVQGDARGDGPIPHEP